MVLYKTFFVFLIIIATTFFFCLFFINLIQGNRLTLGFILNNKLNTHRRYYSIIDDNLSSKTERKKGKLTENGILIKPDPHHYKNYYLPFFKISKLKFSINKRKQYFIKNLQNATFIKLQKIKSKVHKRSLESEEVKKKKKNSTNDQFNYKVEKNSHVLTKVLFNKKWGDIKKNMIINGNNFNIKTKTVFQPYSFTSCLENKDESFETRESNKYSNEKISHLDVLNKFLPEKFNGKPLEKLTSNYERDKNVNKFSNIKFKDLGKGNFQSINSKLFDIETKNIYYKNNDNSNFQNPMSDNNNNNKYESDIASSKIKISNDRSSTLSKNVVENKNPIKLFNENNKSRLVNPVKEKVGFVEPHLINYDLENFYNPLNASDLFEKDEFMESVDVDGISLAEAMERKEIDRKYLFLNARVIGGSTNIGLPTAPEVSKLPENAYETLKTGQQLSFTPSGASQLVFPYQICLFASMPHLSLKPSIRSIESKTLPLSTISLQSPFVDKSQFSKPFDSLSGHNNFLSFNINNYANSPPPQGQFPFINFPFQQNVPGSQQTSTGYSSIPNTPPIFCTNLQPPLFQFPTVPGTADFGQAKCFGCDDKKQYENLSKQNSLTQSGSVSHCSDGDVPCRDGSSCIPASFWCDNKVHCNDVSDEAFCSCRERIAEGRLCDGYFDCPNGEDEIGCLDCPKTAFSCNGIVSPDSCISLSQRCDGVRDCATGSDETDCSALFYNMHDNNFFHVSYLKGYLHRNWKGIWYPVCVDVQSDDAWAKEACSSDLGYLPSSVKVNFMTVPEYYKGPFIVRLEDGTHLLQDHCKGHLSTYVQCPKIKCGTRAEFYSLQEIENRFKRLDERIFDNKSADIKSKNFSVLKNASIDNSNESHFSILKNYTKFNHRHNREETGRVVGGRESEPRAWPWTVAVYKNGGFLCGGVILDEIWILTAAHCMEQYWKSYYEVRGGMLRRFSFSSMEQVRTVRDVILHENYNPTIMSNDLALLRLQKPFYFNRWVRPACLPGFRGNRGFFFPVPGTHCTAVGWGALKEHGIDADQLREVEVPILKSCKHKEDLAGAEICAGKAEGGKDTCQGDSGGPLLCRTSKTSFSWYVAGIVSHGEGCARPGEPGAYTRISLFLNWITANAHDFKVPSVKPIQDCPSFRCNSGSHLCIPYKWICNGYTDCLEAEDEKNCTTDIYYDQYLTQLNLIKKKNAENSERINDDKEIKENENSIEKNDEFDVGDAALKVIGNLHSHKNVNDLKSKESFYTFDAINDKNFSFASEVRTAEINENQFAENIHGKEFDYFYCKKISQSILKNYLCDGVKDCEDGSDESDCPCSTNGENYKISPYPPEKQTEDVSFYLKNHSTNCSEKEYACESSGERLPLWEKCNGIKKCRFGEDEKNCYNLLDKKLFFSKNFQQDSINKKGFVTINKNGVEKFLCKEEIFHFGQEDANKICLDLGWIGWKKYRNFTMSSNCTGFYLSCINRPETSLESYRRPQGQYYFPWKAWIYSDGTLVCTGILIESKWVLTSSACLENIQLSKNYVSATFGIEKSINGENSNNIQIIRVNAFKILFQPEVGLLHLSEKATTTRFVRPVGFIRITDSDTDSERDICVSLTDENFLLATVTNCPTSFSCYNRLTKKRLTCKFGSRIGVIVCQSRIGWYLSSVIVLEDENCDFENFKFKNLQYHFNVISDVLDEKIETVIEPSCDGFRCPTGLCIGLSNLCDGFPDCPTGKDESIEMCKSRTKINECDDTSELKCRNGLCVSKKLYADGKDDCGDNSDEPVNATCLEYLRLTAPNKICNGIRNCLDKTDENLIFCNCDNYKRKCEGTNHCVPLDYVCDGEKDCPLGDDEEGCLSGKILKTGITNEYEILRNSYGEWHNVCLRSESTENLKLLCQDLGFKNVNVLYKINRTISVPQIDPFTWVNLNERTSVALRSDRPLVQFIENNQFCNVVQCN